MVDLIEKVEALDLEFENLDWDDFDESDGDTVTINKTVHHPMSGYASRFEYMKFSFSLTEKDGKVVGVEKSERISGPIPSFMNQEIQDGNRDYDEDEIEDLSSDNVEKSNDTSTYESWEKAIKEIDEIVDFEG